MDGPTTSLTAAESISGLPLNATVVDPDNISPWVICNFSNPFVTKLCVLVSAGFPASTTAMAFWASFALSVGIAGLFVGGCFILGLNAPKDLESFRKKMKEKREKDAAADEEAKAKAKMKAEAGFDEKGDRRSTTAKTGPFEWILNIYRAVYRVVAVLLGFFNVGFEKMFLPRWINAIAKSNSNSKSMSKAKSAPAGPVPNESVGAGWFWPGWYYTEADHDIGVDALVLLRFAKMSRNIFVIMSTVPFLCLLAANVSASRNSSVPLDTFSNDQADLDGANNYTIGKKSRAANIAWLLRMTPRTNDPVKELWAYPIMAILINLIVCAFIIYNYQKVRDLRREEIRELDAHAQEMSHNAFDEYDIAARAVRAVLVTGFTPEDIDTKHVEGVDRGAYEQDILKCVVRLPTFGGLPQLITDHNEEIVQLEREWDHTLRSDSPEQDPKITLRSGSRWLIPAFWLWCTPRLHESEVISEKGPTGYIEMGDPPRANRLGQIKWTVLENYIPFLHNIRAKINHEKHHFVHPPPGGTQQAFGYAMFDDSAAASKAAFAVNTGQDFRDRVRYLFPCWARAKTKIILAPVPGDVLWENLSMEPAARAWRLFFCKLVFLGATGLWIFPNIFSTIFLANLPKLGLIFEDVRRLSETNPRKVAIVEGIVPPIIQNAMYIIIPHCFRKLRRKAGALTRSSRERAVLRSLFMFFIFNNLIVFSLMSATLKYVTTFAAVIHSGQTWWQAWLEIPLCATMKKALLGMSTFWLTYLLQRNIASLLALSQAVRYIFLLLTKAKWIEKIMSPSMQREMTMAVPIDYAATYNNYLFISAVAFCYSAVQPLTIPATAVYYILNYIQLKYNLVRVYPNHKYQSYGSFWIDSVNRIFVVALLGNCFFTIVIMSVAKRHIAVWAQLGLMGLAVAILAVCKAYCHITFETGCKYYIPRKHESMDEEGSDYQASDGGSLVRTVSRIAKDTKAVAVDFTQRDYPLDQRLKDWLNCRRGRRHGGRPVPPPTLSNTRDTVYMIIITMLHSVFNNLHGVDIRDDASVRANHKEVIGEKILKLPLKRSGLTIDAFQLEQLSRLEQLKLGFRELQLNEEGDAVTGNNEMSLDMELANWKQHEKENEIEEAVDTFCAGVGHVDEKNRPPLARFRRMREAARSMSRPRLRNSSSTSSTRTLLPPYDPTRLPSYSRTRSRSSSLPLRSSSSARSSSSTRSSQSSRSSRSDETSSTDPPRGRSRGRAASVDLTTNPIPRLPDQNDGGRA